MAELLVGMLTVTADTDTHTVTVRGPGVDVTAATVPGALRAVASSIDGRPLNPAVVGGVLVGDLPAGVVPLAVAMSIKALAPDGRPGYYERISPDLTLVEALGMLTTCADSLRTTLTQAH